MNLKLSPIPIRMPLDERCTVVAMLEQPSQEGWEHTVDSLTIPRPLRLQIWQIMEKFIFFCRGVFNPSCFS